MQHMFALELSVYVYILFCSLVVSVSPIYSITTVQYISALH